MKKPAKKSAIDRSLAPLNRKLAAAMARLMIAKSQKADALALFAMVCPPVPLALRAQTEERQWARSYAEEESDAEGKTIYRDPRRPAGLIFTARGLAQAVEEHTARTPIGRAVREKLPIARAYEVVRKAAMVAADIPQTLEERHLAETELEFVAVEIRNALGNGPRWAQLKACALLACANVGPSSSASRTGLVSGVDLARTVLGR